MAILAIWTYIKPESMGAYDPMTHKLVLAAASALVSVPLMANPALAAGGGDSTPQPTPTTEKCKKGEVWNEKKKKCVEAKAGVATNDALYEAGRELAYAGRFEEAIDMLELATDQDDPRILNYMGFSHRNAGRFEVGMGYYREALKRDPDYVLARSYMGQALLRNGDRVGAAVQLAEIERRAGKDNWPYESLASAIETGAVYRH